MKRSIVTVAAAAYLTLCAAPAFAAEDSHATCVTSGKTLLTIDVKNVALSQIFDIMAKKGGINYILADNVNPKTPVTLSWKGVNLGDAWEALMIAYGLDCHHAGTVVVVGRPRKL